MIVLFDGESLVDKLKPFCCNNRHSRSFRPNSTRWFLVTGAFDLQSLTDCHFQERLLGQASFRILVQAGPCFRHNHFRRDECAVYSFHGNVNCLCHNCQADALATIRTRKFLTNRLLNRKQMVMLLNIILSCLMN